MTTATSVTVRVPLAIRHRPGRKTVVTPMAAAGPAAVTTRADPALVKALARAFRYQRMLDDCAVHVEGTQYKIIDAPRFYDYLEDLGVQVFYFPYGTGVSSSNLKKTIHDSYEANLHSQQKAKPVTVKHEKE